MSKRAFLTVQGLEVIGFCFEYEKEMRSFYSEYAKERTGSDELLLRG